MDGPFTLGRRKMNTALEAMQIAASQLREAVNELCGLEVDAERWAEVSDVAQIVQDLHSRWLKLREELAAQGALLATHCSLKAEAERISKEPGRTARKGDLHDV